MAKSLKASNFKSMKDYKAALVKQALANLDKAEEQILKAKAEGIETDTIVNFARERARLQSYQNSRGLSKSKYGFLEEAANQPTYYSKFTRYGYEVTDDDRANDDVNTKPTKTIFLNKRELNRIRRKQIERPDAITEDERSIISQYVNRNKQDLASKAYAHQFETQEEVDAFINSFKVNRDVGPGGNSKLLNDLYSYVYNARGGIAVDFVNWLQDKMNDPKAYVAIEQWYRGSNAEQKLDEATGDEMYKKFQSFAIEIYKNIDSLISAANIDMPADLRNRLDAWAASSDGIEQ